MLGCSLATVRRREGQELPFIVDSGIHYLDRFAVVAMQREGSTAPRSPGDRTALAFRMLRDGASLVEVSIALRYSVRDVEELSDAYQRLGRSSVATLAEEHRGRLTEAGIDARSVAELVDVAIALASRQPRRADEVKSEVRRRV